MAAFHGIQVYEILENGNLLNAIYTNTGNNYIIDSEIARKITFDDRGVIGNYEARYIETVNPHVTKCTLEITVHDGVYDFVWRQGNIIWKGIGLMAGTNHIAVSYIKP